METNILNPLYLFSNNIRYTIPAFQRQYVWTQEDQWDPLWDDVRNTADKYLEALNISGNDRLQAEKSTNPHFLGAVVIQQVPTSITEIGRREVIDGQQRLTTLQLLLDAVQYVYEELELKPEARFLLKLITNDQDLVREDHHAFKLWPTTSDREAFRHAMHNGLATDDFEDSLIVQAHEYFQTQAKEWLQSGSDSDSLQSRAEALQIAVTGLLQMVVIDLTADDDPHVIFETLNARGTPLLESDLIKNYVISKVSESSQNEIWGDMDDDWWGEETGSGRYRRPRKDTLLNHWLVMRTQSQIAPNRIFREFRSFANDLLVDDLMADVKRDLGNYRQYENGERTSYEDMFRYRVTQVMRIGVITPALLHILSTPCETRINALKALESFLIRSMLCRGNSRSYDALTLDLVRELHKHEPGKADRVVINFLRNQTSDPRQWPSDSDIEDALVNRRLYRALTQSRLRLVLEGIEENLIRKSVAGRLDVPKNLSIEHVMPQSWNENWPLPDCVSDEEIAAAANNRNRIVHTIGNLTLVNPRLNPELSNDSWENKRKKLRANDNLFLNKRLLDESRDTAWDEDFIEARSRRMAKLVAEVWPGPESSVWDE